MTPADAALVLLEVEVAMAGVLVRTLEARTDLVEHLQLAQDAHAEEILADLDDGITAMQYFGVGRPEWVDELRRRR